MSYSNLLEQMMQRDTDAFLEFTDRYGWTLYNSIRRKHPNKVDADKVYHETMQQLWTCLQNEQYDDPMEAILCVLADQITLKREPRKDLSEIFYPESNEKPPVLHIRPSEQQQISGEGKRKNRLVSIAGVLLLFLIFTFSIWIILGFLMEYGFLTYVDLGYSWFCRWLQQALTAFGLF